MDSSLDTPLLASPIESLCLQGHRGQGQELKSQLTKRKEDSQRMNKLGKAGKAWWCKLGDSRLLEEMTDIFRKFKGEKKKPPSLP